MTITITDFLLYALPLSAIIIGAFSLAWANSDLAVVVSFLLLMFGMVVLLVHLPTFHVAW